jgi:hypothetical protein
VLRCEWRLDCQVALRQCPERDLSTGLPLISLISISSSGGPKHKYSMDKLDLKLRLTGYGLRLAGLKLRLAGLKLRLAGAPT